MLATIHRAENTDDPQRLAAIVAGLQSQPVPVVLAGHPRLLVKAREQGLDLERGAVHLVAPYGYPQMIAALQAAAGVVTDSGGLQKEAYLVGTPCTTVRTETEWVELLDTGWNELDPDISQPQQWLRRTPASVSGTGLYGDGHAAEHVATTLVQRHPG